MRRFLSLLLVLCLLAAPALTPAALAEDDSAPLPAVGDVVCGFEAVETRDYAMLDAVVVRFQHRKTGAELYYIANDDTNRAFNLAFFTDAIDNTGLPHVFEHATIQGSRKYPGEQMFFNLSYQTYNTFMNAITDQKWTCYPLASLSEAQLLKLAEFYTDACFYPIIMENEHIFRTEAWRYRMETPEDELSLEGTVYSEMLGEMDLDKMAGVNYLRAAFPGSMAGNIFGGDPAFIPDMTWQALKDYHDLYYHPSNSVAYLYGQFEDYTAFLALLDSYYSRFERRETDHSDPGYVPITGPVVQTLPFPVEQGSGTEHASSLIYAVVCPGLKDDPRQENILNTLTDLFVNEGSALHQRLKEALPYCSFISFMNFTGPEDAIVFRINSADPGDAETFKAIVDAALADVAENGFPQELVDSVSSSLEISARLVREVSDPVNNVILPMLGSYAATANPWAHPDYTDALSSIRDWNAQGLYAQAVSEWLLDNPLTVLVTTYPEPGAKEAETAALAEKLAGIKAGMSEEEIAAIVEATNGDAPEDHSAEYVAQLKAVSVASLPEDLPEYEVRDETDEQGIRHIEAPAAVDGISSANIFLDAAALAQEDIHWFILYTDLLGDLDTAGHTKAELATLWGRYLYDGTVGLSLPREGEDGYHPYLHMSWIALDDDLAAGYDLMHELLYETKTDDAAKLLDQVQALKANMKSSITASPANLLLRRGLARTQPLLAYNSYAIDLDYYEFLSSVEQLLRDDPAAVTAKLESIKAYFNNRTNAVTMCIGSEKSLSLNRELADAFLDSLDAREITPASYDFPIPEKKEAVIIDSGVQHNLLVGDLAAAGLETFDGGLSAVANLVSDNLLIPLLRDTYGVYTPMNIFSEEYTFIYAYRDPNIAETYQVLAGLPEQIEGIDLDQDTLDGYIMNAYSGYAMPMGALSGPMSAALDVLQGKDPARYLDYMRELKALTPEAVRDHAALYAALFENGAWMTGGAASTISQNAELYDAIYNPFGAVDKTQAELSDAKEGDAHYEAVRFAFEQGLMLPLTDERFGTEEPASLGDLLAAAYVLAGGSCDAEEALAVFADYGLVPASADLAAPIAPEDVWGIFSALTGSEIPALIETAAPDAVTRGELAEALTVLLNGLG